MSLVEFFHRNFNASSGDYDLLLKENMKGKFLFILKTKKFSFYFFYYFADSFFLQIDIITLVLIYFEHNRSVVYFSLTIADLEKTLTVFLIRCKSHVDMRICVVFSQTGSALIFYLTFLHVKIRILQYEHFC